MHHTLFQPIACHMIQRPSFFHSMRRRLARGFTLIELMVVLVKSMKAAGWDIPSPPASMFAWAPIPEPYRAAGSMAFAKMLIEEAGVAVAPGLGFGEYGEGFVRIGLVENEHRIRQAARNVKMFIQNSDQILSRSPVMAGL